MKSQKTINTTRLAVKLLRPPFSDTKLYPLEFKRGDALILIFFPFDSLRLSSPDNVMIYTDVCEDVSIGLEEIESETILVEVGQECDDWCKEVFFGLNAAVPATLKLVNYRSHVDAFVCAYPNVKACDLNFSGKPSLIQEAHASAFIRQRRQGF